MKKINIFNRNIDLPSYRHMPVSRGIVENRHTAEARCPGQAKRGLAPQEIFHCETMKNINVCDASFCIRKNRIPAFAGMTAIIIAALFAVPAMATQDEIDQKTVTSKYYVDQELATKQNTITTDKILFHDGKGKETSIYVPAIVATNATGTALNGNTIGVLDYTASTQSVNGQNFDLTDYSDQKYDDFIPTVRAVAQALNRIYNYTTNYDLNFNSAETTATNNYSVSFSGQNGNWPQNDYDKFVKGPALADGLALKQNKIDAGTAGNVVTYTGTAGSVGSVAVASTETYNNQNQLTNGSNIANVQLVSTKQDKMTCAGYVPGHENDINYCWLYGDVQVAAAAAPSCVEVGSTCDQNNPCCSGLSCMPSKGGGFVCNYQ